jgi:hypothetical protein
MHHHAADRISDLVERIAAARRTSSPLGSRRERAVDGRIAGQSFVTDCHRSTR